LRMAPLGYKLFKRGRLPFRPSKIKRQNELAAIMKRLENKEGR